MKFDLQTLLGMAYRSVTNPREGAEEVLALGIPKSALWPIMLLVVVLSSLLTLVTNLALGAVGQAIPAGIQSQPILIGGLQLVLLLVMVSAIFIIGRRFGGKASFEEAMLLVAWLQFVLLCLQVVQAIFLLVMPPLGGLIGLIGLVLTFWLLTNFVLVAHGFKSAMNVFVMILVSGVSIVFALSFLLLLLGVQVPTGAP